MTNTHCPYCGREMTRIPDSPLQMTKEHFIPRTLYLNKKNIPYDFYACRECNNVKKSKMDELVSWISKLNSMNDTVAVDAFAKALTRNDRDTSRAEQMLDSFVQTKDGYYRARIPITWKEYIEYTMFLIKGKYFLEHEEILDDTEKLIEVSLVPPLVMHHLEQSYIQQHGTDPFSDLSENVYTKTSRECEARIWCKENQYLFIFFKYWGFSGKVIQNSRTNRKKVRIAHRNLQKNMSGKKLSEFI